MRLKWPASFCARTNGGRQMAATSLYRSSVCAAEYLCDERGGRKRIKCGSWSHRSIGGRAAHLSVFGSNLVSDELRMLV